MVNVNDSQMAEFNMAVSFLNRLNSLFYIADEAAMGLDAYAWFHSLMAIYREISPLMKLKDCETSEEFRKKIHSQVAKNFMRLKRTGTNQIDERLYDELHRYEILLRGICKKQGLLMRMQEDAAKALK